MDLNVSNGLKNNFSIKGDLFSIQNCISDSAAGIELNEKIRIIQKQSYIGIFFYLPNPIDEKTMKCQ